MSNREEAVVHTTVKAAPAKRFFVEMLTRDIELQDAILDLLDNCVDGALRSTGGEGKGTAPYEGYWAKISFDAEKFVIEDNCGGIPKELAENYAFRLGRPDPERDRDVPTVGAYGIGMKRAIFKMGQDSTIESKTAEAQFKVKIPKEWMDDDSDWNLSLDTEPVNIENYGTRITIDDLRESTSRMLSGATGFDVSLKKIVSAYYGYIISKGFTVFVNNEKIEPVRISLLTDLSAFESSKEAVVPYIYRGELDGVSAEVSVGLYVPIGAQDEDDEDGAKSRPSSDRAGWTIICNDRVVLFADKTRVTGWGDANVPQYHPQFVSIAGVVIFRSNDAKKLPITTTKRGIDGNSLIYLAVKNAMRDGLKQFTDFTNRWKSPSPERSATMKLADSSVLAQELPEYVESGDWKSVKDELGGKVFRPRLPKPKDADPYRSIQFSRRESEIDKVKKHFFDQLNATNSAIGNKCFEDVLERIEE